MSEQPMRSVRLPADRVFYRPMTLALMDQMSVCERRWSVVCRFHQESHDAWHVSMTLHSHPSGVRLHSTACLCGGCP